MNDRVFHDGLQRKAQHAQRRHPGLKVLLHVNPLAKAHVLNLQIAPDMRDLLAEPAELLLMPDAVFEHRRQRVDPLGDRIRMLHDRHVADGVERIEQEVRVELGAQ